MPKRSTKPIRPEVDEDDDDDDQQAAGLPQDPAEAFSALLAGADDGGSVYVSRFNPATGQYAHVAKVAAVEFDPENIRREFGGGKYRAALRTAGGTMAGSRVFEIAGPPVAVTQPAPAAAPAPSPAPVQAASSPENLSGSDLLRFLIAQGENTTRLMLGMMQAQRPADSGLSLRDLLPLFTTGRTDPIDKVVGAVAQLQGLAKPNAAPEAAGAESELAALAPVLVELIRTNAADKSAVQNHPDLIRARRIIAEQQKAAQAARPAAPLPAPTAPESNTRATVAAPPGESTPPGGGGMAPEIAGLVAVLRAVIDREGTDPAIYAEMLADVLGEDAQQFRAMPPGSLRSMLANVDEFFTATPARSAFVDAVETEWRALYDDTTQEDKT